MYNDKAHVTIEPKTRTLIIPKETKCIGVVGDNKGERVDFDIPRYYDGIDLGTKRLYIVVSNDPGEGDTVIPDVTKDEEQLHISWTVLDKHVAQEGGVTVRIEAKDDDGFCWQSFDGEFEVRGKQDGEQTMPDAQITAVEQTLQEMEAAKNRTLTAASAALAASAQTAIPIVPKKEGEVITVNDGANRAVRAIKIYGRTTQSGTPTPSTTRPLVTVGAGGNVKVSAKVGLPEGGNEHITIITQPRNVTVTLGANAMFSVASSGVGLTYQWQWAYQNSTIWNDSGNSYARQETFYAEATTGRNGLRYRCVITDANGNVTTTSEAILTIGDANATENPVTVQTATIATPDGLPGVPVTEGGNYTDANGQQWISDTIEYDADDGTEKHVRRIERLEFDGSENYQALNGYFRVNHPGLQAGGSGLCTIGNVYNAFSQNGFYYNSTYIYFRFDEQGINSTNMTVSEIKEWVAAHPFTLHAILAEPIETQLSAEETAQLAALMTHHPNTTIYNEDSAHMGCKYVADTKTYIDNLVASAVAVALANK